MGDDGFPSIEDHLQKLFTLNSKDQIEALQCKTSGFCSKQFKFRITKNDKTMINIFVKMTKHCDNERYKLVDKEIAIYTKFIPAVIDYIRKFDSEMLKKFQSCFIKLHARLYTPGDTVEYIVMEDFMFRNEIYTSKFKHESHDAESVVKSLGMIHGAFYSWQKTTCPEFTPEDFLIKYPVFSEKYTSEVDDENEGFIIRLTSALNKIIKADVSNTLMDGASKDIVLEILDRVVSLSPYIARLRHEIQKPRVEYFCPTFGDVHSGNIAITSNAENILFYDFGLIRLSSPLIDFQHYISASLNVSLKDRPKLVSHLFDVYSKSFIGTVKKLQLKVEPTLLIEEFHTTLAWSTITTYFVILLTLSIEGASQEDEDAFVAKINGLDSCKDRVQIMEEVETLHGPVQSMVKKAVEFFLHVNQTSELDNLESMLRTLQL